MLKIKHLRVSKNMISKILTLQLENVRKKELYIELKMFFVLVLNTKKKKSVAVLRSVLPYLSFFY